MADGYFTEFEIQLIVDGKPIMWFSFFEPLRKPLNRHSDTQFLSDLRRIVRDRLKNIMVYRDSNGECKPFTKYRITAINGTRVRSVYARIETKSSYLRHAKPTIDVWECFKNSFLTEEDDAND